MKINSLILPFIAVIVFTSQAQSATILYEQDFENPAAYVNDGGDVNLRNPVNTLYGNQPLGFTFAQTFTVETLLVTGNQAFGTGYSDPSGTGGNYTLGMQSRDQDDKLGLSFDIGSNDFLNVRLDISSIDISVFSGPFVPTGAEPVFKFTLFDNPSGDTGIGNGTVLSTLQATGAASEQTVFDWTEVLLPLDATGNTNGNVTLQIDLLSGGYAAIDDFLIVASDIPGEVTTPTVPSPAPIPPAVVPVPAAVWLFGSGLIGLIGMRKKASKVSTLSA